MKPETSIRLQKWALLAIAIALALLSVESVVRVFTSEVRPPPQGIVTQMMSFLQDRAGWSAQGMWRGLVFIIGAVNIGCLSIAAWVMFRVSNSQPARQTVWLLITCAAIGYWSHLFGISPREAAFFWDAKAYPAFYPPVAAGLWALFFMELARFLMIFPRVIDPESIVAAMPDGPLPKWVTSKKSKLKLLQLLQKGLVSGRAVLVVTLAFVAAIPVSAWLARLSPSGLLPGIVAFLIFLALGAYGCGLWLAWRSIRHVHLYGTERERSQVYWLKLMLPLAFSPLLALCVYALIPHSWRTAWTTAGMRELIALAFFAYLILLPQLIALVLASAVVQRGTLDPRAGFSKITIWGVLSLVMTVLFVIVERYVALKLVKAFELPPDTGAIVAGGVIAATFIPIRRGVTKLVTRLAERWLPVSAVVDGERVFRAVAITDLSGYTALAATDDAAARMQSGVLKRAAQLATEKHGGRIVKTLGDAVMMVYETSRGAALGVRQIHRSFPAMIAPLGYTPLPLHSAVHYGEIAETHDGDIFGHTVNVTARLVDVAKGGEIALSADAANQAQGLASLTDAGEHHFKNVTEAIHCFKLSVEEPPKEAGVAAQGIDPKP